MAACAWVLSALLAALAPDSAAGASAEGKPPGEEGTEPLTGVSPVELVPRIEVRQRFTPPAAGGAVHTTTLRIDIEFLKRTVLRYELPVSVVKTASGQISGIGDIQLDALFVLTSGPRQTTALLGGLVLDSATRPALGAGKQQVSFGAAGVVKPRRWWLILGVAQETLSYAGDPARPDVNQLALRLGNVIFGRDQDWLELDLLGNVNFAAEQGRFGGTLETGRLLVGHLGLYLRGGTTLVGHREADYFLEAGARYLFRLEEKR
jgi:hypothetical protein